MKRLTSLIVQFDQDFHILCSWPFMLFKELICSLCRINVPCGLLLLPGV